VHLGDAHHFLDAVFLFVLEGELARAIDLSLGREIDAPVIADTDGPDVLALLEADESEIAALADHHRLHGVPHAIEPEELLIERTRLGEAFAFKRAMRKNFWAIERGDARARRFLSDRVIHSDPPSRWLSHIS
jgi:hypothetical protein